MARSAEPSISVAGCALLLLLGVKMACGHNPGGGSGLPGTPGDAYHTDQLGGNVWIFNSSDPRIDYMKTGRNGARFPSFHAGHKQLSVGNKTVFFDAINALVPWEFNGKIDGTDEVVDSIVEGATFTRPYRGGMEQQFLPPYEYHLIYDKMLTDFPLLDKSLLTLSDNPKEAINASQLKTATQRTKSSHFGYMVTDTYLAEQLLTALATNNFPPHVLDQYVNRTMAWTAPYWMTSCTVQLYVLLPYNIIVEFDIAYYDRYREKHPELNLPEALYWHGAHDEISLGESMAALSETPRTEFNTYLCNLTWNSTLGMTLEQAGLNQHTGPSDDNRNWHLHKRVKEDLARNSSFYEKALNDTDALKPLEQLETLTFDNGGISFAVIDSDLVGSYNCSYTASSVHSFTDAPSLSQYGVLKLSPTAKSSSIYTSSWSIGVEPKHVRGASSVCAGVAAKMSPGPQPEVFSVSIGLARCSAGNVPSTMLLQVKSKSAISIGPRLLHDEHLDGDSHYHDQAGEHDHHHHHHHHHEHSRDQSQLLLDGMWATGDGMSYQVACVQQHEHTGLR
eukprot:TRINITY_DN106868_c0_g1_i1.p1 TRINITY_DN106868_c0_g1~~TRINITY_DN106868_c0_g1_i1.p1  ORF type:complete len:562 (+),score=76.31 TRINITY_DN106868_c0_g1_i1:76-1761(+)